MESYLMMLYVTLEQESALKSFFVDQGWAFCKPDMSVVTDKVGPVTPRLSIAREEIDVTNTHPQEEQQVSKLQINTEVKEKLGLKHSGKRKTKSQNKPTKAPKQAKIVHSTSVTEPGEIGFPSITVTEPSEIVEIQEKNIHNVKETCRPITVEIEGGQEIQIKVESVSQDTNEGEQVGDVIDDAEEENNDVRADDVDDDSMNDVEAADDDYEEENIGDTNEKPGGVSVEDSSISEIELPESGAAPKHQRKKRGKRFRHYGTEKLLEAYKFVMETGSPVRTAARMFDVPVSTLGDRVHNRVSIDVTKNGPGPVLSKDEETRFTAHLIELVKIGYGYSQVQIKRQASNFAIEVGKRESRNPFSARWYTTYAARYPEQDRAKTFTLPKQKSLCTSKECIINYYNKLNGIAKENSLDVKPENIYIMDEVDIDVPDGEKCDTVTVIGAGNAEGQKIPPYFVLVTGLMDEDHSLMRISQLVTQGFKSYLNSHFIKYATSRNDNNRILVLYDAHRMHVSVELIDGAKINHILLFAMPSQSSHIVKTSGEGVFQSIKTKYNEEYGEVSPYKHLTSTKGVVSIVKDIYEAVVTPAALKESFSKCGIYPLQKDNVMCDFLQKQGIID